MDKHKTVVVTGGKGTMAVTIGNLLTINGFYAWTPTRRVLDVTNEVNVKSYMEDIKPYILINCAGYIKPSPVSEAKLEDWQKHFDVNVTGAFLCSKYAIQNGCKVVINIGSTSALAGRKDWGAYCASKVALMSLTETLAEEGIFAVSVNPARTNTAMRKRLFPKEDSDTLMTPERVASCIYEILVGGARSGSHIIIGKDFFYILPQRRF
jgi:NAD(P)-dependent dehydrogenase (short-subunit alcohol dehydrogenase family)